ncbi:hypothetical protein HPP92_004093 [Vanilla planifolia]|uniref:LOB domain-containing protein n=1 Tax=Vanilla planifolia TaxID=51239 RepID=A0A835S4W0_VANPL|nr:hypothetical protein HPP92_004093 [Vanilla planifolia]
MACLISSRQNDERRRQVCRLGRDIRRDLPKAEQTHTYSLLFVSDPMESTSAISAIGNGQKAVSMGPTSPCAGCKFLRRKCQPDCVFAPYFPADQPQKFINVHKVFGASNVTKILNDLQPHQRQDAVTSLAYEAETRLQDKVYGCVGIVSVLQYRLVHLNHELSKAWAELSRWKAAAAAMAEVGDANQGVGMGTEHLLQGGCWHTQQQKQQRMMMTRGYMEPVEFGGGVCDAGVGTAGMGVFGEHFADSTSAGVNERLF